MTQDRGEERMEDALDDEFDEADPYFDDETTGEYTILAEEADHLRRMSVARRETAEALTGAVGILAVLVLCVAGWVAIVSPINPAAFAEANEWTDAAATAFIGAAIVRAVFIAALFATLAVMLRTIVTLLDHTHAPAKGKSGDESGADGKVSDLLAAITARIRGG